MHDNNLYKNNSLVFICSLMAGAFAVIFAAFNVSLFLFLSNRNFLDTSKIIFLAHVPLAVIEGIVTAFLITWLKKTFPDFLLQ